MKKSIAVIKTDELRSCPMGLGPINLVCKHVGQAILQMQPLDNVPSEQREKYAAANRKIYTHHQDGTRCPFADQFIENRDDMVNCDFGENGAGEHSIDLRPSPFYPKVFMGMGQGNLWGFPLGDYSSSPDANQSASPGNFTSYPVSSYSSLNEEDRLKTPNSTPISATGPTNSTHFYTFEGAQLIDATYSEETHGNN